jgi:vitamin B12 transporter
LKTHLARTAPTIGTLIGFVATLAALPATAIAQSSSQSVVVTGTRLPLSPAGLAQTVTVIDRKAIEEINPARIEDLLARVTGVYVDQAGPAGGFASMYMRAAENSHLLLMLAGVKLNDPTTTRGSAYDLSSIAIEQVERIEVLRGPASAVYGGEALAGVVHIITKRTAGTGVAGTGYAAAGGDGYRKLGGSLAFGKDALQAQIGAGSSEDGSSGERGQLRLRTVSGSVRLSPSDSLQAELFATQVGRESEAFPDDSGGPRLAVNRATTVRDSTDRIYGLRLGAGDIRSWRIQALASVYDRREAADNAAVDAGVRFPVPAFTSDTDFKRTNLSVAVSREFGSAGSVVAGLEYQKEDGSLTSVGDFFGAGSPQTLTFELERDTKALFVEGRIRLAPTVSAQVGVRHDRVRGLDAVTTPHLGLVWDASASTTVKLNANEGFKPPSFFALGFPIGGNPALEPERSKNLEGSVAYRWGGSGSSLKVSVYQTRYENLVDFDGATFTNINRGTIVVRGIEPELQINIAEGWKTQVGATLLDIDERDGLQPLRNRPERVLSAALLGKVGARSTVFVGARRAGSFLDRSNPTGDIEMRGYTVFDASYTVELGAVRLSLALDNVFDKTYEAFVGFPAQGRRLRAEVRAGF